MSKLTSEEARWVIELVERDIDVAAALPRAQAEIMAPPRVTIRNKLRALLEADRG